MVRSSYEHDGKTYKTRFKDVTGTILDSNSPVRTLRLLNVDTLNVTDMSNMFANCTNLTYLNLMTVRTRNVTNMSRMFYGCTNLSKIDVDEPTEEFIPVGADTTDMFTGCGTNQFTTGE